MPLKNVFEASADKIPLNDPQVYRQINEIGRFTRDIKHISGVDNVFADYLSRIKEDKKGTAYQESDENTSLEREVAAAESVKFQLMSLTALQDVQKECPEIERIRSGDQPKSAIFGDRMIDGINLFCELTSDRPRPYVPAKCRGEVMTSLHFDHLGIKSMTKRVAEDFYWPSLKGDIKVFVKKCPACSRVKAPTSSKQTWGSLMCRTNGLVT